MTPLSTYQDAERGGRGARPRQNTKKKLRLPHDKNIFKQKQRTLWPNNSPCYSLIPFFGHSVPLRYQLKVHPSTAMFRTQLIKHMTLRQQGKDSGSKSRPQTCEQTITRRNTVRTHQPAGHFCHVICAHLVRNETPYRLPKTFRNRFPER